MPKDRFVASHTHCFLVLEPRAVNDDLGYDTAFVVGAAEGLEVSVPPSRELNVVELVKSRSNPFADRISIGRASNCDVVLGDSSVSKLHAHVRESNGELVLTDVGSQNGTLVNGDRLQQHVPMPIKPGDRVQFGTVCARVADAATVHDLVHVTRTS